MYATKKLKKKYLSGSGSSDFEKELKNYKDVDYGLEASKRVSSDPLIQRRANRTYADVYRSGVSAGTDYQASTGQGSGTAGGGSRAALLRVLGSARGAGARDNMMADEEKFQAGALADSDRANSNRLQMLWQIKQSEMANTLAEKQLKLQERLGMAPYLQAAASEINTAEDLESLNKGFRSPSGQGSHINSVGRRIGRYTRLYGRAMGS